MKLIAGAGLSLVMLIVSCGAPPPAAEPEPKPAPKVEPKPAVKVEPPPPRVAPVKLKTIAFFEAPAAGEIKPATKFPRVVTRNISFQLECLPAPGAAESKKDFLLTATVSTAVGVRVHETSSRQGMPTADAPARIRVSLFEGTDKLRVTAYRVVLTADGLPVGSADFSIDPWFPVTVTSVDFFEGTLAEMNDERKGTTFPKATTRAVHAVVTIKNNLAGKGDQSPAILARWRRGTNPAGAVEKRTLILSGDIPTVTETFKIGWDEPGRWPAERTSLDLDLASGDKLGSYSFAVEDGCVPLPADHPLQDATVKFFLSGSTIKEEDRKKTDVVFNQSQACFVNFLVESKNRYHQKKDSTVRYRAFYFYGGTSMGDIDTKQKIQSTWATSYFSSGRGYDEPGQWEVGHYRVEVWIDDHKFKDLNFEIREDRSKIEQEADALRKAAAKRTSWDKEGKIADLTKSIQLHPTVRAHVARALVRNDQGDFEGAMADFSRALDLFPRSLYALRERCRMLTRHDQKEGALADASKVVEIDPSMDNLRMRAQTRSTFLDFAGAEEDLNKIVRDNPKNPDAYIERAELRKKMGRLQDSLIDLSIAIDLAPDREDLYQQRAEGRLQKGDRRGGSADLDRMLELSKDKIEAYLTRARIRQRWGDAEGGLAELQRAIEANPKSVAAFQARADARLANGDVPGATADCDAALLLDPKSGMAHATRARAKREAKDLEGAAADFEKSLDLEPMWSSRLNELIEVLLEKGDVTGALAACTRQEERKHKLPAHDQRARLLARIGRVTEALQEIETSRKKSENARSGASTGLPVRTEIHFRKGDTDSALKDSEELFRANSWSYYLLRLAGAYDAAGRPAEALGVLREKKRYAYGAQEHRMLEWVLRSRSGETDAATKDLAEASRPEAAERDTLPFLITAFLTGKLGEEQLAAQAAKLDRTREKKSLAQVDFYVGQKLLVQGEKEKGLERLRNVLRSERTDSFRYWMAMTELARAGQRPIGAIALGIQAAPADGKGVAVAEVVPGTYADRAGLLKGDVILEVAGRAVSPETLHRATLDAGSAPSIALKLLRNGEERTVEVKP